jgi:hypothetical protein
VAPLIDLVNRLRGDLDEKVLEAKRTRLRVAEATLELVLSQRRKTAPPFMDFHTQASERCCRGANTLRSDGSGNRCPRQVVGAKHPREEEGPPRLSLATALPLSVWQDHLTPQLSRAEAVRLRGVCKALRGVMDECPVDVGALRTNVHMLQKAFKCFPATQSMDIIYRGVVPQGDGAEQLLEHAVRNSALLKLTYFKMKASDPEHGEWLSDGRLRQVEEVCVALRSADDSPASMQHLRQLPHLLGLTIQGLRAPTTKTVFPAFIPPSLKTLTLDCLHGPQLRSLLRQLPPTLQASGASLVELKVISAVKISEENGIALARVLQSCSSTLKDFCIIIAEVSQSIFEPDTASEVVLGLESCCEGLERLEVPWEIFKSLPPTCPTFVRLTHLTVKGDDAWIDLTSPVWDRVANGLLPALTDLHLEACMGLWWGRNWACRVFLRALEAVAGTLRRLTLDDGTQSDYLNSPACHELGLNIGKMRRLSYLSLRLSPDGKSYEDIGGGLAASGGCPPLFELHLDGVKRNMGPLAYEPSLIVPSVRSLHISGGVRWEGVEALMLYCELVQMGYKYGLTTELDETYKSCLAAIVKARSLFYVNA